MQLKKTVSKISAISSRGGWDKNMDLVILNSQFCGHPRRQDIYGRDRTLVLPEYSGVCPRMVVLWVHDDVIKWKHFPRYWPFVRGIHRWPSDFSYKGQWCGALIFSLICAGTKRWWFETSSRSLWSHCNAVSSKPKISLHFRENQDYWQTVKLSNERCATTSWNPGDNVHGIWQLNAFGTKGLF